VSAPAAVFSPWQSRIRKHALSVVPQRDNEECSAPRKDEALTLRGVHIGRSSTRRDDELMLADSKAYDCGIAVNRGALAPVLALR